MCQKIPDNGSKFKVTEESYNLTAVMFNNVRLQPTADCLTALLFGQTVQFRKKKQSLFEVPTFFSKSCLDMLTSHLKRKIYLTVIIY